MIQTISLVSAQDFFDEVASHVSKGEYGIALTILQENCPILTTEVFNHKIWKCNFNIAFVYQNLALIHVTINGEETIYYQKELINLSREHYKRAIEIYDLNPYSVNFSPPIFLAHIEVSTGNYAEAINILSELEEKMSQLNLSILDLKGSKEHAVLFTTIPKLVSPSINEIGFLDMHVSPSPSTHNEISLNAIFTFDRDIPFIDILSEEDLPDSIELCYKNFMGKEECNLVRKDKNGYFKFNENLNLQKEKDFPSDTYSAEITVTPPIISDKPTSVDAPLNYEGVARFEGDKINIKINRTFSSKIIFYLFFIITLFLLWKFDWSFGSLVTIISFLIALFSFYDFLYLFSINAPFGFFNIHIYFLLLFLPIKFIILKSLKLKKRM